MQKIIGIYFGRNHNASAKVKLRLSGIRITPQHRTKPITTRKLGDDFDCTAVLDILAQKAAKTAPKQDGIQNMVLE